MIDPSSFYQQRTLRFLTSRPPPGVKAGNGRDPALRPTKPLDCQFPSPQLRQIQQLADESAEILQDNRCHPTDRRRSCRVVSCQWQNAKCSGHTQGSFSQLSKYRKTSRNPPPPRPFFLGGGGGGSPRPPTCWQRHPSTRSSGWYCAFLLLRPCEGERGVLVVVIAVYK